MHLLQRRLLVVALLLITVRAVAAVRFVLLFGASRLLPDVGALLIYGFLFWELSLGRRWAWWLLLAIVVVTIAYSVQDLPRVAREWQRRDWDALAVLLSIPVVHLLLLWELVRSRRLSTRTAA
jgi:hypothetical protein